MTSATLQISDGNNNIYKPNDSQCSCKGKCFSKCKISALPCNRQNRIRFILHVSAAHQSTLSKQLIQKQCKAKHYLLKVEKKYESRATTKKTLWLKTLWLKALWFKGQKPPAGKKKTVGKRADRKSRKEPGPGSCSPSQETKYFKQENINIFQ